MFQVKLNIGTNQPQFGNRTDSGGMVKSLFAMLAASPPRFSIKPACGLAFLFPGHSIESTTMTYEEFLDEVTTLLTELYDLTDEAAIKLVVDAQANDYFVTHDDKEELRTFAQAKLEAAAIYQAKQNKNETQRKQQQRQVQKKKAP